MLDRIHPAFSEDHLRARLRAAIGRPDADVQIASTAFKAARLLVQAAAIVAFVAAIVVVRGKITPAACAVGFGLVALLLVCAAGVLWDYARIARLLVRLLQRHDKIAE